MKFSTVLAARAPSSSRRIAIEAVVAGALVMTVALVMNPSAPGQGALHPHLLWIAVLVLAAQYGIRGLVTGLFASVVALSVASIAVGEGLGWLAERFTDSAEILAFAGAVVVSWVAGGHERRKASLAAAEAARTAQAKEAMSAFDELRSVADALVRQTDRAQHSVSYLRSIAERIESDDQAAGADAAIELAVGRTGARVGAILLHDGTRLRLFAHRGTWSATNPVPPDVFQDRTAEHAFKHARPITNFELGAAGRLGEFDSEVAAPILNRDGKVCGVLVVRGLGVNLERASIAHYDRTLHELAEIARWVSGSLVTAARPPVPARDQTGYSFSFRSGQRRDVLAGRPRPQNQRRQGVG